MQNGALLCNRGLLTAADRAVKQQRRYDQSCQCDLQCSKKRPLLEARSRPNSAQVESQITTAKTDVLCEFTGSIGF